MNSRDNQNLYKKEAPAFLEKKQLPVLANDVVVLLLLRLKQITDSNSSNYIALQHYIQSLNVSKETRMCIRGELIVSNNLINKKLQSIIDYLYNNHASDGIIHYKTTKYHWKYIERIFIKEISSGYMEHVDQKTIEQWFLKMMYCKLYSIDIEDRVLGNRQIDLGDFIEYANTNNVVIPVSPDWKTYLQNAVQLIKTKIAADNEIIYYSSLIHKHDYKTTSENSIESISITDIRKALQLVLDKFCFIPNTNKTNKLFVRNQERDWYMSKFPFKTDEAIFEVPSQSKIWARFQNLFDLIVNQTKIPITEIINDDVLAGKKLISYGKEVNASTPYGIKIFVADGAVGCQRHHHTIANVRAIIKSALDGRSIKLPIQKCIICNSNRAFVNRSILEEYERRYGKLLFNRTGWYDEETYDESMCSEDYSNLDCAHILYQNGYTVSQKVGLSDRQRQDRLLEIISKGIISKSEAMTHIGGLINRNKSVPHRRNAVEKWSRDYSFLAHELDSEIEYYGYLYK